MYILCFKFYHNIKVTYGSAFYVVDPNFHGLTKAIFYFQNDEVNFNKILILWHKRNIFN